MRVLLLNLIWLLFIALPAESVVPVPLKVTNGKDGKSFIFKPGLCILVTDPRLAGEANELQQVVKKYTGHDVALVNGKRQDKNVLNLILSGQVEGDEGYILEITDKQVSITGSAPAGVFYGVKTLEQLLLGDGGTKVPAGLAAMKIVDKPRFGYRALMLDPARHFLPVEDVRFFIDQMAKLKFNKLQLHLTDDQGWRIEIRKFPDLTCAGAFRDSKSGPDGPHNGYYTQEQLKDLVAYAAVRHIEIIPELDIPGHTVAMLAVYPELGCTVNESLPKVVGQTQNMMVCAAKEDVYKVYSAIIDEVSAIFPSRYIHLGGDEAALEKNWAHCDRCRELMKRTGYEKPRQLMGYFFNHIDSALARNGKEPMLWCELDQPRMPAKELLFDYPENSVLFTWRYGLTPKCIELTREHGFKLIAAPGEYCYFDYPQRKGDLPEFNNWGMPLLTLEQAYKFDPGYGLPAAEQAHIIGVAGLMWGECIQDIDRVFYMTFPRALALAEAGWSEMENRDWDSFRERMYPVLGDFLRNGVNFRVPFEVFR